MTKNDTPQENTVPEEHAPTVVPPARPERRHPPALPVRVLEPNSLSTAFPQYASTPGASALSYAIISGRAPHDPHHLWALVVLCIAAMVWGTWNRRHQ